MSRAIDRKIAELMGYTARKGAVSGGAGYNTVFVLVTEKGQPCSPQCDLEDDVWASCPEFVNDWNAMRLLVEWLKGKGLAVRLVIRTDGMAQATVYKQELHETEVEETLPLALCNVVLSLPSVVIQDA